MRNSICRLVEFNFVDELILNEAEIDAYFY